MNKYFIIILIGVILAEGCTAHLPKFKCVYDLYGDSTKYYGAPDKPCGVGRADANPKLLLNDT